MEGGDEKEIEKRGERGNRLKKQKIYGRELRKEAREEMRMQWKVGFGEEREVNACEETMQACSFYLNWTDWH